MNTLELAIYKLKNSEVGLEEFEKWVYEEKSLEDLLPPDEYLELISLGYKTASDLYKAEKILFKIVNVEKYYEWNLRRILEKVINRTNESAKYIQLCYQFYCDGYDFLDNLGLGYGLSITVPSSNYKADEWDGLTSSEQKKLIDSMYPAVADEALKVISWLDTGKIVITGHDGSYQGIKYDDNRSDDDKKPTAYKVFEPKEKWWKFWE